MKPILNEQEGWLYWLKRRLVRSVKIHGPEAMAWLIKQIEELEKDMGLRATEEPKVYGSGKQPSEPRQIKQWR